GKMAQYSLIPDDIAAVLDAQNVEMGTGALGENHDNAFQYTLRYRGRLVLPEEFADMVIRTLPSGEVLRVRDVAEVKMGRESYAIYETAEGQPASGIAIYQSEGTNANATIKQIDKLFDDLSHELPKGLRFATLNDTSRYLYEAIDHVVWSFVIALILVLVIVYIFLQDFRATLIPMVGIIVSVVGTFGFLYLLGFSINLLTLFALVLCIGTVVDDSIVVVEAVQSNLDSSHTSRYHATINAIGRVSTPIIVATLIFMSVFIPVSMIGGTSGTFYTQFGLTMAAAVGLSAVNALTLSPVLCTLILRHDDKQNGFSARFKQAFSVSFGVWVSRYKRGVLFFFRHKWICGAFLVLSVALLAYFVRTTKTGLVPQEDTSLVFCSTTATPGTSLSENLKVVRRADSIFRTFPEIELCVQEAGFSFIGTGPYMGQFLILLKEWDQRKGKGMSADDVVARIYGCSTQLPEVNMVAFQGTMIPGYSYGNNLELYLQDHLDGGIPQFQEVSQQFVAALNKRPEIAMAYASFSNNYPQYQVSIDAAQCQLAGVSTAEVLSTMGGYLGGRYVSNFNRFSKVYRVMMQAAPNYRVSPEALDKCFVRTPSGMAPLSRFVTLTPTMGPEYLTRFNLYSSIPVTGVPASGYSTGEALKAVAETAREVLPNGYGYEYGGLSREESSSNNNILIIFIVSISLIYLILCCLYESFLKPLVVILAIPCGLMGSFLFARLWGLENNIYLQTAAVMLIGLMAKTAILITDCAGSMRQRGYGIAAAAIAAARMRFRPILMTSLTMIFGMLPLMFATGAGAKGNATIGTCVVGGMIVGTVVMLYAVPVLWALAQRLHEMIKPTWLK
ncbi:MAG: efflux RND transporter permease subunit, partial [Bacteroidales bacterium]|nr:efflux RND transporter permease subunit [Candidatus Colimorpha onthohippi]